MNWKTEFVDDIYISNHFLSKFKSKQKERKKSGYQDAIQVVRHHMTVAGHMLYLKTLTEQKFRMKWSKLSLQWSETAGPVKDYILDLDGRKSQLSKIPSSNLGRLYNPYNITQTHSIFANL